MGDRPATHRMRSILGAFAASILFLSGCQSAGPSAPPAAEPMAQAAGPAEPASAARGAAGEVSSGLPMSREAIAFIIDKEVGSRAIYEGRYASKPHWDGGRSGILIGLGYNLGTVQPADVRRDWGSVLSADDLDRIAAVAGMRPRGVDRVVDQAKMQSLLDTVIDIEIPWDDALDVFETAMLPVRIGLLRDALENTDALHPHSFGALVSLVYNRGATFERAGDRFREMRAIKTHMSTRAFEKIPGELRSMARLWPTLKGLRRRRAQEADLFQKGLDAQKIESGIQAE